MARSMQSNASLLTIYSAVTTLNNMHRTSSLLGSLGVLVLLLAAGTAAQDSNVGAAKHNRPPGGKRSVCIIGAGQHTWYSWYLPRA
jgi:hypothetical protein